MVPGTPVSIFATPWELREVRSVESQGPGLFPDGLTDVFGIVIASIDRNWSTCLVTVDGAQHLVEVNCVALEPIGEPDEDLAIAAALEADILFGNPPPSR